MQVLEVQDSSKNLDSYFMKIAEEVSTKSNDPCTKVGACIVKNGKLLSSGYNGTPKNFPVEYLPTSNSDDLVKNKNSYMCHAELNAIINYNGNLHDLKDASIYCTISPCHECIKTLIQVGIKEVIYKDLYHRKDIVDISNIIADKCGIYVRRM